MARAKKRRYADGGDIEAEEIVVRGKRPMMEREVSAFDLARIGGGGGSAGIFSAGEGSGSGTPSQRLPKLAYDAPRAERPAIMPAILRAERSELSDIIGDKAPRAYGAKFSTTFSKGGKAKPKKMAKGGSTASKRADGCATKGKTKGRFV